MLFLPDKPLPGPPPGLFIFDSRRESAQFLGIARDAGQSLVLREHGREIAAVEVVSLAPAPTKPDISRE